MLKLKQPKQIKSSSVKLNDLGKKEDSVKCPECGSTNLWRKGERDGRKKYQCKNCKKYFIYPLLERAEYKLCVKPKTPSLTEKEIAKIKANHAVQTVDSIADIPCFGCKAQSNCEPKYCQLLEGYLNAERL